MSKTARCLVAVVIGLLAVGPLVGAPAVVSAAGPVLAAPLSGSDAPANPLELLPYGLAVFGAIKIRDTASLAKKFVQRAGAATNDYKEGVATAGADWEKGAREGADNYKLAVIEAANQGRFEKGVAAAGGGKFTQRAQTLGAQRYGPGVQASEADWQRGYNPYAEALRGLELPAKRPRGQNAARSNAVADRQHQMRVGNLQR